MYESSLIKHLTPLRQGAYAFSFGILGILLTKILSSDATYQFALAFTGILLFALVNCGISIFKDSFRKYTWPSWGIFALLIIGLLLSARYISGDSIQLHREFIKILFSVTLFYIILSLLVRLIRFMWEFAENDVN